MMDWRLDEMLGSGASVLMSFVDAGRSQQIESARAINIMAKTSRLDQLPPNLLLEYLILGASSTTVPHIAHYQCQEIAEQRSSHP